MCGGNEWGFSKTNKRQKATNLGRVRKLYLDN